MSTTVKGKRPVNILYGADERPPLFSALPVVLQQVVFLSLDLISSFSLATVIAIVTNLVFRFGVKQSRTIEVEPTAATADRIFDFLEGAGAS